MREGCSMLKKLVIAVLAFMTGFGLLTVSAAQAPARPGGGPDHGNGSNRLVIKVSAYITHDMDDPRVIITTKRGRYVATAREVSRRRVESYWMEFRYVARNLPSETPLKVAVSVRGSTQPFWGKNDVYFGRPANGGTVTKSVYIYNQH
jgi:hypothetical protein